MKPSICIVGNLNIDLMMYGFERLPGWGEEQFCSGRRAVTSGQAGYMALGAAALGANVSVMGVVGDDEDGDFIVADLSRNGIETSGVTKISGGATGLTVAVIRTDGERCFVSDVGASASFNREHVEQNWQIVTSARAMAMVGVFNTPGISLDDVGRIFAKAQEAGVYTVFDPGWDSAGWPAQTCERIFKILASVDLFLPNEDEALAITGAPDARAALLQLSEAARGSVVVKCGSRGSIALVDTEVVTVAAQPVDGANAVGAGDLYDAALTTALQSGKDFKEAMTFASRAAEYYVARLDNRYPSLADLT
jgi:ribokinase